MLDEITVKSVWKNISQLQPEDCTNQDIPLVEAVNTVI